MNRRIVCLGDSTVNPGPMEWPWSRMLGEILGVECFDRSVPCATLRQIREQVTPADEVILLGGINDVMAGRSLAQMQADYLALLEAISAKVWSVTILPYGSYRHYRPQHEATRQAFNDWLRADGAVDLEAPMTDLPGPPPTLVDSDDGLHTGDEGRRFIAGELAERLTFFRAERSTALVVRS